jgi:hypothetical protein
MFVGSAKPVGEMSHDVGVAIADSLGCKGSPQISDFLIRPSAGEKPRLDWADCELLWIMIRQKIDCALTQANNQSTSVRLMRFSPDSDSMVSRHSTFR